MILMEKGYHSAILSVSDLDDSLLDWRTNQWTRWDKVLLGKDIPVSCDLLKAPLRRDGVPSFSKVVDFLDSKNCPIQPCHLGASSRLPSPECSTFSTSRSPGQ